MMKWLIFNGICSENGSVNFWFIVDTNNYFDEVARFAPGLDGEALECYKSLGKGYRLGAQCGNGKIIYYEG